MLLKCTVYITDRLYGRLPQLDRSRYSILLYGLQLMISFSANTLSILLCGLFLFDIQYALAFYVAFMFPRFFTGGLHAKTFGGCFLLTNATFLISCLLAKCVAVHATALLLIFLVSAAILFLLAPHRHPNQPINAGQYRRNKIVGRLLLTVYAVLFSYLLYCVGPNSPFAMLAWSLTAVTVYRILPIINERRNHHVTNSESIDSIH